MQITCSLLVYELKMAYRAKIFRPEATYTRWFKYDRDDLRVNKSQFVPVIFEPPCILFVSNMALTSQSTLVLTEDASFGIIQIS